MSLSFRYIGHQDVDFGGFTFPGLLGTETLVERHHQVGLAQLRSHRLSTAFRFLSPSVRSQLHQSCHLRASYFSF